MNKKQPKHKRIYRTIKDRVIRGSLKDPVLSESRLIQEFKVSATTAKKVLNDLQNDGFLERKVGIGSVLINPSEQRCMDLGVVFFDVFSGTEPHIANVVNEIDRNARNAGYHLHLFTTRNKPFSTDNTSPLRDLVIRRKVGGLFILSPIPSSDLIFLQEEDIPFVVIGNDYPNIEVSSVTCDFTPIFNEIEKHFSQYPLSRVAVAINGIPLEEKILRGRDFLFDAYQSFLTRHNLPFDENHFIVSEAPDDHGEGATESWYALPDDKRPTIIIAGSSDTYQGMKEFLALHDDWNPIVIPTTLNSDNMKYSIVYPDLKIGETAYEILNSLLIDPAKSAVKKHVPMHCYIFEKQR